MPNLTQKEIAFNALFVAYYKQLCRFAYRFVDDMDMARELVQDAYVTLWEKGSFLRSADSLKSFLHTAVKHNCLNHIQHNNTHNRYKQKIMLEYAQEHIDQLDWVIEKELQEKIDVIANSLPEQCRRIFIMNRYKNLKYREIADLLGISTKAVEAQMSKALQKMRVELADYLAIQVAILLIINT